MDRKLSSLLLAAIAAALIAAGCGGDDGETSSTEGEPLSKEEFIAQADQICTEGDAKIDEGGKQFAGTGGEKVDELVRTVIVPGTQEQIEQLRALNPPEADQAQFDEFVNTLEQGMNELAENPEQIVGGGAIRTIIKARRLARQSGLDSCARGS